MGDLDTQLIEDFSLASVTTVLLDTWDTGYDWTEGVRTDEKVQYDRPNQGDHKGDEYTYDTVREIISDGEITSGAGKFAKLSDGTIYISVGDEITSNPITIDETADTLAVNSSGVDWYNITQGIGARPIRLVTFMNVYAGEDQTVENGALYDHRKDVELTMMDELQDNLILGIDDFDSEVMWATAEVMGFPSEKEDYLNNETNFFEAYTNETDFSASQEAWLNTEVWLAEPVTDDTNTTGKTIYYGENDTAYVEGLAVKLAGYTLEPDEDTPLTTTQSQWTGSIPLATDDLKYDQTYIVAYYWLLADGRYRTDYKIVTVEPEEKEYDVTIQVFNENDDLLEDETYTTNEEAMMLGADLIDNTVSVTSHTVEIDFVEDVEESTETYVAWNHYDPAYRVTRTELIMTNNADFVVGYVETLGDLAEGDQITIPITTYYTQTGEATYEYVYTEVLNDGDSVSSQDQDITYTYQDTMAYTTTDQYTYTVEKDANGNLYLAFDKGVQVVITEDGEEETVLTIQDISYNITFNIYVEEIATVDVTKVVSNYNANMKDQSFIINLDGDYDTQVDLNHNETSKPVITVMQDGETRILTVSETVPMEFTLTGITYTVESYDLVDGVNVYNKSEPAALDAGEELIVNAGDMVHITFTNTYASQGYFKDRAEKANVFTNQ
ncbi:hypothetical protein RFF05_08580 [Bengtsoniella intestinalis]|uniref:hypothetical protein n=1 Tax=Bengtsoniella intestinalis TaxID=3073143 RepID=UPI00391F45E3